MCCAPTLGYHGQPPGAPWGSPLSPMGPHLGSLMETPRGTPWERLGETKGGPGECPAAALGNPLNPGWRKLKTHQKIKSFNPGAPVEPRGAGEPSPSLLKAHSKPLLCLGRYVGPLGPSEIWWTFLPSAGGSECQRRLDESKSKYCLFKLKITEKLKNKIISK